MGEFMREYTTARTIFGILEFIAWVAVAGGLLFALVGASAATGFSGSSAGLIGAVPGLLFAFIGIIAVAIVQSSRANVDTAEMTGKMLQISKEQLQIAKDGQKASFAAKPAPAKAAVPKETAATYNRADFDPVAISQRQAAQRQTAGTTRVAPATANQSIEYKGETIVLDGAKASVGGLKFATVDAARNHIDRLERHERREPVLSMPTDRLKMLAADRVPEGLA